MTPISQVGIPTISKLSSDPEHAHKLSTTLKNREVKIESLSYWNMEGFLDVNHIRNVLRRDLIDILRSNKSGQFLLVSHHESQSCQSILVWCSLRMSSDSTMTYRHLRHFYLNLLVECRCLITSLNIIRRCWTCYPLDIRT